MTYKDTSVHSQLVAPHHHQCLTLLHSAYDFIYFIFSRLMQQVLLCLNVYLCRMDTTLVNFSEMKWERGDITFLFIGEREHKHSFYVLDNKFRVYQKIRYQVAVFMFSLM